MEARRQAGPSLSASKSAVLPTFTRVAASRTVKLLAMCPRARLSLSSVTAGLRPPVRPRAAARPEQVEHEPAAGRGRVDRLGERAEPHRALFRCRHSLD